MFYVKVERPIYLKGEKQAAFAKLNQQFGLEHGIYLVDDGMIHAKRGDIVYLEYAELFEILPIYRSNWDEDTPIEPSHEGGEDKTTMNLYLTNGLLLQQNITVDLEEVNYTGDEDGGPYLLLCSYAGKKFQVLTM